MTIENREIRFLRAPYFSKIREQVMDWIQWAWTPLLAVAGFFWHEHTKIRDKVSKHDSNLAELKKSCEYLGEMAMESKTGREQIYSELKDVRRDLSKQHETLRREQREDFQEIRKVIAAISE
jgi:hypothetical protein